MAASLNIYLLFPHPEDKFYLIWSVQLFYNQNDGHFTAISLPGVRGWQYFDICNRPSLWIFAQASIIFPSFFISTTVICNESDLHYHHILTFHINKTRYHPIEVNFLAFWLTKRVKRTLSFEKRMNYISCFRTNLSWITILWFNTLRA